MCSLIIRSGIQLLIIEIESLPRPYLTRSQAVARIADRTTVLPHRRLSSN